MNQSQSPFGHIDMSGYRRQHGIADQMAIIGDDWTSERDKKAQAKAEAAVKKAALATAKKLNAAAESLNEFLSACLDAGHEDRMGSADGRRRLSADMLEYSGWLEAVYGSMV